MRPLLVWSRRSEDYYSTSGEFLRTFYSCAAGAQSGRALGFGDGHRSQGRGRLESFLSETREDSLLDFWIGSSG